MKSDHSTGRQDGWQMNIIDRIAETRIQEALERGELKDLPGEGKAQQFEDDSLVPPELRAGYRMLKNAGFLPPELELRKEVRAVEELVAASTDPETRRRARIRLDLLVAQLSQRGHGSPLWSDPSYRQRLLDHLDEE